MNLFVQHSSLGNAIPFSSHCVDSDFYSIPEERSLIRKQRWVDFIEDFRTSRICFCDFTLGALDELFLSNRIIQTQTEFELELSFSFYLELLNTRKFHIFCDKLTAKKFLALSLIYSKFYNYFIGSVRNQLKLFEEQVSQKDVNGLFQNLLVKYEVPGFFLQSFENLTLIELEIIIPALHGRNLRKHPIFENKLTKSDFSSLMQLPAIERYEDNLLIRASIYALMDKVNDQRDLTLSYVRTSKIFNYNPNKYFADIAFWQKGLELVAELYEHPEFNLTDTVDYLDYMRYLSLKDYSLKGRTPRSLLRSVNRWHGRIYKDNHEHLRKLKWKPNKDKMDLHFDFQANTFRCIQLVNGEQLHKEGVALEHCVITYALSCSKYQCTIWSLQLKKNGRFTRYLTLEEVKGTIIQARKRENELPDDFDLALIEDWAERMEFEINLDKNE